MGSNVDESSLAPFLASFRTGFDDEPSAELVVDPGRVATAARHVKHRCFVLFGLDLTRAGRSSTAREGRSVSGLWLCKAAMLSST